MSCLSEAPASRENTQLSTIYDPFFGDRFWPPANARFLNAFQLITRIWSGLKDPLMPIKTHPIRTADLAQRSVSIERTVQFLIARPECWRPFFSTLWFPSGRFLWSSAASGLALSHIPRGLFPISI
jgi:hypothetical protein